MKKQEMHPEKDQYRSGDKNQTQDRSSKTKPSMEEKTTQKAPRTQDADEKDQDFADYEKKGNRLQSNDNKKAKY